MAYLLENASELLRLAGALALFGVFILFIFLTRTIIITTRVIKKVDDLTDLIVTYVAKPVSMIIKAERTISSILKRFGK